MAAATDEEAPTGHNYVRTFAITMSITWSLGLAFGILVVCHGPPGLPLAGFKFPVCMGWMIVDVCFCLLMLMICLYLEMYTSMKVVALLIAFAQCLVGILLFFHCVDYYHNPSGGRFLGYLAIVFGVLAMSIYMNFQFTYNPAWTLLTLAGFQFFGGILLLTNVMNIPVDLQKQFHAGATPSHVFGWVCIGLGLLFGSVSILGILWVNRQKASDEEIEPLLSKQEPP